MFNESDLPRKNIRKFGGIGLSITKPGHANLILFNLNSKAPNEYVFKHLREEAYVGEISN